MNQIEVVSSGFTFEEPHHLKRLFLRIRDRLVVDGEIPKISVAIDPLDKISWPVYAMKHHVVLMSAERGLRSAGYRRSRQRYQIIFAAWISEALDFLHKNRQGLPRLIVKAAEDHFSRAKNPRAIFKSGRLWRGLPQAGPQRAGLVIFIRTCPNVSSHKTRDNQKEKDK